MISVGDPLAPVLLEKMGGALDHAQVLRARDQVDEALTGLGGEDRDPSRRSTRAPACPSAASRSRVAFISATPGASGEIGTISGNWATPALDSGIGPRRLVGRHDLGRHIGRGRALDHEADRQVGVALGEVAPGHERLVHLAREEPGVHDHQPFDAVGILGRPAQSDRAAPVLDHHRGVAHVELFEQPPTSARRDGRTCTNRARSACPSGRNPHSRGRSRGFRPARAVAASCGTGRTRSARRGSRPPEDPSPSSR